MIRRWGMWGLLALLIVAAGAGVYSLRRARGQTPLSITGPNIVPNNDWSQDADQDRMPDGWTRGTTGVELSSDTRIRPEAGPSMRIQGINNFLQSPYVTARPGVQYRVALRALTDNDVGSPTALTVRFHWRNDQGVDLATTLSATQPVAFKQWSLITTAASAPVDVTQVAISLHPASDDRIYVADLSMGQLGVRVEPWPDGKRAALSFSFDYETAMGGLVHSRSLDDPHASEEPEARGLRMRAGLEQALKLFAADGIRATFYTNGYNFLSGNRERRQFMGNPTYTWADSQPGHGWPNDRWDTTPWFSPDPYSTEAEAPAWYFGSQITLLKQAGHAIESHTFAHFVGSYVTPADWRADFAAWRMVAAAQGVAPATSLAFPWSSSAGMSFASWDTLEQAGIRSVTRTVWDAGQRRSWIADREHYALRRLPAHAITVIADEYLTPDSGATVLAAMRTALLNEGAIDVWAHTEEVTSPEQIAVWQRTIAAAQRDFWIAPVPEIVQYAEDVREVSVRVEAEQPRYRFVVHNGSTHALSGVTLGLPFAAQRVSVDGVAAQIDGTLLLLDLGAGQSRTVTIE